MLHFFRKYQRFLFLFTTIIIVISFVFFGTFSTLMRSGSSQEKPIMELVDGRKIRRTELDALVRMITPNFAAHGQSSHDSIPNLLNADLLAQDFFKTKIALILAEKYFDSLKPELQEIQDKVRRYQHYVHPEAPFISAAQLWKKFAPGMAHTIEMLKKEKIATPATVGHLMEVYLDQRQMPAELMRKILSYEQSSYPSIKKDPSLAHADLNLFGFSHMEQWFGKSFLEMVGSFILNGASIAEKRGYKVSAKEAKADLWKNLVTSLETYAQGSFSSEQLQEAYQLQLRLVGLDEGSAVMLWSKVMAFRKMLHEKGESVFLDPLFEKQLRAYAHRSAHIELYRLPYSLRSLDFLGLLKLHIYLEEVAAKQAKTKSSLMLPTTYLSVEEIEKHCPEFVHQRFFVEMRKTTVDKICDKITLKQTWEWQIQEASWKALVQEFPFLAQKGASSSSERFSALDSLNAEERLKVDQFARHAIVEAHPEWIRTALETAVPERLTLDIRSKGTIHNLAGIANGEKLAGLMEQSSKEGAVLDSLQCYTEDNRNYYSFTVLESPERKAVLLFAEALEDGTLDALLDKRLQEHYPDVRRKEPSLFQTASGSWKNLAEVRDLVGERVFFEHLKAIADSAPITAKKERSFYVAHRFDSYLKAIRSALASQEDIQPWIAQPQEAASLASQWRLEKSIMDIPRTEAHAQGLEKAFSLQPGELSDIEYSAAHANLFFKMLEHSVQTGSAPSEILNKQHALSVDAQRFLTYELLAECERHAVSLIPSQGKGS